MSLPRVVIIKYNNKYNTYGKGNKRAVVSNSSELFLSDEIQVLYENSEPTREALRELRDEFNRPSFRKKLVEAHGCKCVVCGTTEDVQVG